MAVDLKVKTEELRERTKELNLNQFKVKHLKALGILVDLHLQYKTLTQDEVDLLEAVLTELNQRAQGWVGEGFEI